MPVYPDLEAIFVHIPKTAGGAIEEYLRAWQLPKSRRAWPRLASHLPLAQPLTSVHIRGHDTARWIRTKIGTATWDRFFSFAVIRNPYDRLISSYEFIRQTPRHHNHRAAQGWDFETFLSRRGDHGQTRYLTGASGDIIVDRVIAFEHLARDLPPIFDHLGVSGSIGADRGRNTSRKNPPGNYLTPRALDLIHRAAAADFSLLGYRRIADAADYRPTDAPLSGPAAAGMHA